MRRRNGLRLPADWRPTLAPPATQRLTLFAAVVIGALAIVETVWIALVYIPSSSQYYQIGMDYRFFRDIGARWLADGSFYLPRQLAGPYTATTMVDVLYPPVALFLFIPATLLPAALWWFLPAAILTYAVASWRPAPWAWLAIAIVCLDPSVGMAWLLGSSSIWMAAITAATLRWRWPAVFLAIKPFLLPLGLPVAQQRLVWAAGSAVGIVSLAMLPLWADYVTAMRNASIDPLWAARDIPVVLLPVIARLGAVTASRCSADQEPIPRLG